MIHIYISTSHSKIDYRNASDNEIRISESILRDKFKAKNDQLARHPLVRRGIMSMEQSFYDHELNLLPTGLIPYLRIYFKKSELEFEVTDLRKFPAYDKEYLQQDVITLGSSTLRDYQLEVLKVVAQTRGGIVQAPTGVGKGTMFAALIRLYPYSKILCLFNRIDLVMQTRNELINTLGFSEKEIGVVQGQNFQDDRRITLLSIQSYEKTQHLFPRISVIVMDECFPGYTTVLTETRGWQYISSLVRNKSTEKVLSFNRESKQFEYKNISNWYQLEKSEQQLKIYFKKLGNVTCTKNHPFYVVENNQIVEKKAETLKIGDECVAFPIHTKRSNGISPKLSPTQYQAVLGMILGDGCLMLTPKKTLARMHITHGEAQIEYLKFKMNLLSNMQPNKKMQMGVSGYNSEKKIFRLSTQSSLDFKKLYDKIYIDGTKTVKHIIDEIDEVSFAFWFMDDGYINAQKRNYGNLSTHSFSYEENVLIAKTLKTKFDIDSFLCEEKRCNKWYLRYNRENVEKISFLIRKYVPPSMQYKLFEEHRGQFDFEVEKLSYGVKQIERIETHIPEYNRVYNITVDDNHNYVVNGNILVSNCHETGRNPTSEKIIYSCQNAPIKIGLTATTEIDNAYERMKMFSIVGPIVYKSTIKEKIDEKYLAKIHIKMYEIGQDVHIPICGSWADIYEKRKITKKFTEQDAIQQGYQLIGSGTKKFARKFVDNGDESNLYIFNQERNQLIANLAKKKERCLILFDKIKHGYELQKLLPDAFLVHGESTLEDREKAKKLLKDNPKQIVLASTIFATGVNIPAIRCYINAAAGKSNCKIIQKLGRTTRLDHTTNKTSAEVIDFYDRYNSISIKQSKKRLSIYSDLLEFDVEVVSLV